MPISGSAAGDSWYLQLRRQEPKLLERLLIPSFIDVLEAGQSPDGTRMKPPTLVKLRLLGSHSAAQAGRPCRSRVLFQLSMVRSTEMTAGADDASFFPFGRYGSLSDLPRHKDHPSRLHRQ